MSNTAYKGKTETIIRALRDAHGNIGIAARVLETDRGNLSRRIHKDPVLEEVLVEEKEKIVDILKNRLIQRAMKDDRCLMFALERLSPEFRPPQLQINNTVSAAVVRPDEETIRRAREVFAEMEKQQG